MKALRRPPTFGRNDKVARRVVAELERRLAATRPDGAIFVFAIGAPIRKPALLIDALTPLFSEAVARRDAADDGVATVLGNRVRFRLIERADANGEIVGCVVTGEPVLDGLLAALTSD